MVLVQIAAISGSDGGIGDPCCDAGDRFVSDGVGTSKTDGDDVEPGGAGCEDSVVGEIDVDGASPRVGGGTCKNCGDVGNQSVDDSAVGSDGLARSPERLSPGCTLIRSWARDPRARRACLSFLRKPPTLSCCERLRRSDRRAG